MGEYDLVSELCDICVTSLRARRRPEGALLQLGAVADAEDAEKAAKIAVLEAELSQTEGGDTMTHICKASEVSVFDNSKTRYTIAKVKAFIGADRCFNGGLF